MSWYGLWIVFDKLKRAFKKAVNDRLLASVLKFRTFYGSACAIALFKSLKIDTTSSKRSNSKWSKLRDHSLLSEEGSQDQDSLKSKNKTTQIVNIPSLARLTTASLKLFRWRADTHTHIAAQKAWKETLFAMLTSLAYCSPTCRAGKFCMRLCFQTRTRTFHRTVAASRQLWFRLK